MSKKVVKLENIHKIFQTEEVETSAVDGVSLHIDKGEYIAISGPSGCGKSTLLSILGLLDGPTQGKYYLNERDVTELNRVQLANARNREIGFIFQSFNLIESLSVIENVELPLVYRKDISARERRQRAEEALESVGMSHRKNHRPTQLSGGQQQRVAVARAFVNRPELILADEPTGNLDSESAGTVMQLIKDQHAKGATICIVTHDPRYTRDATRTIHLLDGKVRENHV
ncbi:MAG TPA: ABC transporter ATP-binding protein [Steroidobacteraceae bacterium]|nr:ABC transporter ATP-binding protein [Steroidobacteraceae bacterium]